MQPCYTAPTTKNLDKNGFQDLNMLYKFLFFYLFLMFTETAEAQGGYDDEDVVLVTPVDYTEEQISMLRYAVSFVRLFDFLDFPKGTL